jgi:hypothetical protein
MAQLPLHVFRNLYFPSTWSFKSLWSRMRFVAEVIAIGGGLPGFLGASCSGSAFSAPVVCMSMSVVLRGAKKLWANTTFWCSLTAVDAGTVLIYFLAICTVLLEICLLRLFTSWKLAWAIVSYEILSTTLSYLCTHFQDVLQSIQPYRIHAIKNAKKWLPI